MSEWKQGAAARRDARATKTDEESRRRGRRRKSTRRWCKGKVGVEHVTKPVEEFRMFGKVWGRDECIRCHKHVKHWSRRP